MSTSSFYNFFIFSGNSRKIISIFSLIKLCKILYIIPLNEESPVKTSCRLRLQKEII